MNSDEEYKRTKDSTDKLLADYMDQLAQTKGGVWTTREMATLAPIDYSVHKQTDQESKLAFYIEAKLRRHQRGRYRFEKVPISKWTFAYTFKKVYGINTYYLIGWKDAIGIIDLNEMDHLSEQVARYDRGDATDLYAMYDYEDFHLLTELYKKAQKYIDIL